MDPNIKGEMKFGHKKSHTFKEVMTLQTSVGGGGFEPPKS